MQLLYKLVTGIKTPTIRGGATKERGLKNEIFHQKIYAESPKILPKKVSRNGQAHECLRLLMSVQ